MARRRNWRRLGENLITPGTKTTPGLQVQVDAVVQEAVDKEYNEDVNAYDHSGVGSSEWAITWRKNYFLCKI